MATRAEHLPALPLDPHLEVPAGLRVAYAKHVLHNHLVKLGANFERNVSFSAPSRDESPPDPAPSHHYTLSDRVAIVGAGATGLYLAMLLKRRGFTNVDIYEASDRIGGRCYTYNFPDDKDCPHNFYDIGAMRIPEIPAMKSTLDLIEELNIPKEKYVLDAGCEPEMRHYSEKPDIDIGLDLWKARISDIISKLSSGGEEEFQKLIDGKDDNYSTRAWLMHTEPEWSYELTESVESSVTSTGLFDQAFIESLCDYSDFQASSGKPWWRVKGGMSTLTDKMNECIKNPNWISGNPVSFKVKTKTPVVGMSEVGNKIEVTLAGEKKPESYDMVFNTTAMGPLQRMDIEGLVPGFGNLYDQSRILTGIRTLSYDRACKVAIKFKTRWWKEMYKSSTAKDIFGGVSSTDLSISNVVYPSWDDGDKAAVLMASYSWAQDATRMGALIPDYSKQDPSIDDEVVKQSLQDLAKLWSKVDSSITVDFLREQYVTHHAYAWSHDPYTGGAFALFGPGQFKYVYPQFQQLLCGGKFAICGEALSPHHAWISGALDSAYLTFLRWMKRRRDFDGIELMKNSWFGGGKGEHPAEFDEALMYWSVEMTHGVSE